MEEFQLTADSIKLLLEEKKIKQAMLNSKAFILSSTDSVSVNQISGLNMKANFENNKLTSINVLGNGESIYYVIDDETDENIGLHKIICSNMFITMEENSLKNIKFFEQPTATMYPIKDVTTELKLLKNYKYLNKGEVATKIKNKTK
jgi:trehalose-6-phosphatase